MTYMRIMFVMIIRHCCVCCFGLATVWKFNSHCLFVIVIYFSFSNREVERDWAWDTRSWICVGRITIQNWCLQIPQMTQAWYFHWILVFCTNSLNKRENKKHLRSFSDSRLWRKPYMKEFVLLSLYVIWLNRCMYVTSSNTWYDKQKQESST